jgi:hypothetical protein
VWRRVFAIAEVVGAPAPRPSALAVDRPDRDAARDPGPRRGAARGGDRRGGALDSQQSHIRIEAAHYARAVEAIASVAAV